MSDEDHKRDDGSKHEGAQRTSPYPLSRLAPPHDLVNVAREIQKADETIRTNVGSKLKVIAEQIRTLQDQAHEILESAERDSELHRARCHFARRPGHVYHLYRKDDDSLYFSMLSPEDWGHDPPHHYEGSYRLEADMSWTPVEDLEKRDDAEAVVEHLLGSGSDRTS